jgi:membrane-bound serine protease (ClpP class)
MLLALAIAGLFFLPDPWRWIALLAAAVVEVGELYLWMRFLGRYRVTTGAEGLLGERVQVISPCAPEGRVTIRGEIWKARCDVELDRGAAARVRQVDGLTLVLEPEERR